MMLDFENLNKFQKMQISGIVEEWKERNERLKPVFNSLEDYIVLDIWEFGDFQVAKVKTKRNNEIFYAPFHNYKKLHEYAYTFDQAILICLAYKYEGPNSKFPEYAERMLNMKCEPEQE